MEKIKNVIKKIPFIPTIYRNIRDKRLANRDAAMTPFGFKIIANDSMQQGKFEPVDTKIFRNFVEDADVVIDAGAHVGYYCLQALSLKKHIIAFEPMPLNAKTLLKNISINGWEDNAEVFQLALADKPGILKMYGSGTGASLIKGWAGFSSKKPVLVPSSSLDLVIGNRLAGSNVFILIDVERAEYELLKGAKKYWHPNRNQYGWSKSLCRNINQKNARSIRTISQHSKYSGKQDMTPIAQMKIRNCNYAKRKVSAKIQRPQEIVHLPILSLYTKRQTMLGESCLICESARNNFPTFWKNIVSG